MRNPEFLSIPTQKPEQEAISTPESSLERLNASFESRVDTHGVREVILISNERPGGCPFHCTACGVHEEAVTVRPEENRRIITDQIHAFSLRLEQDKERYEHLGYHLCIYNNGNTTNPEELSKESLDALLEQIDSLSPAPSYISIDSRGPYVTEPLLEYLDSKRLGYRIHFILGVETQSEKGKRIYGKAGINKELGKMFGRIDTFNENHGTRFGIDAGFVFLPEFYTDDRSDTEAVRQGFKNELLSFVDTYAGQHTPLRINIHPFYPIAKLPYRSSADSFDSLMAVVAEVNAEIARKNATLPEHLRISVFIGVNDSGYETEEWKTALEKWWRYRGDQSGKYAGRTQHIATAPPNSPDARSAIISKSSVTV